MSRETNSDSDEDIWDYSSSNHVRTNSKIKGKIGSKSQTSANIAQAGSSAIVSSQNFKRGKSNKLATARDRKPIKLSLLHGAGKETGKIKDGGTKNRCHAKSQSIARSSVDKRFTQRQSQSRNAKPKPSDSTNANDNHNVNTSPQTFSLSSHLRQKRKSLSSSTLSIRRESEFGRKRAKKSVSPPTELHQPDQGDQPEPQTPIQLLNSDPVIDIVNCPFCQMSFRCLRLQSPGGHAAPCMDVPLKATDAESRLGQDKLAKQLDFGNSTQEASSLKSCMSPATFSTVSMQKSPYFNNRHSYISYPVKLMRRQESDKSVSRKQLEFTSQNDRLPQCPLASGSGCVASDLGTLSSPFGRALTVGSEESDDDQMDTEDEDIFLGCELPTPLAPFVEKDLSEMIADALGYAEEEREAEAGIVLKPMEECWAGSGSFAEMPKIETNSEHTVEPDVYTDIAVGSPLLISLSDNSAKSEYQSESVAHSNQMPSSPQPTYQLLMTNRDYCSQKTRLEETPRACKPPTLPIDPTYAASNVPAEAEKIECLLAVKQSWYGECLDSDSGLPDLMETKKEDDIEVLLAKHAYSTDSDDCLRLNIAPTGCGKAPSRIAPNHTESGQSLHKRPVMKIGTKQTSIQRFFSTNCSNSKHQKDVPMTVPPPRGGSGTLKVPPPSGGSGDLKLPSFGGGKSLSGVPPSGGGTSLSVVPPHGGSWHTLMMRQNKKTTAIMPDPVSRNRGQPTHSLSTYHGSGRRKQCPFYKKMPGTPLTVDAFRYGTVPGCKAYILTHFHYDHYEGLTRNFAHPIYCSKITGNLVVSRLKVNTQYVTTIPLDKPTVVEGVELTFMEANHCPGSVIILFKMFNGPVYLHTGDFRACPEMEKYPALQSVRIDKLYLDTTYCDAQYAFPSQKEVVDYSVAKVKDFLREFPNTLIVVGSYTIGKERIFMAIAKAIDACVCVAREKMRILECLEDAGLIARLTLNKQKARVHVLPMKQLKYETLSEYLRKLNSSYDRVLAFEPTGWTHARGTRHTPLDKLRPKMKRHNITIYGVPYSEHSSYSEMRRFCQVMNPASILATVNNGDAASRARMEKLFADWMKEPITKDTRQGALTGWFT